MKCLFPQDPVQLRPKQGRRSALARSGLQVRGDSARNERVGRRVVASETGHAARRVGGARYHTQQEEMGEEAEGPRSTGQVPGSRATRKRGQGILAGGEEEALFMICIGFDKIMRYL